MLRFYQESVPSNGRISISLKNGYFYQGGSSNSNLPSRFNPTQQKWYKLAISNENQIIWTNPYFDYARQDIVITAAKTVTGANGVAGVVAIDFNLIEISNLISESQIGEYGLVMLLNRDGTVLANRDHYLIGENLFSVQSLETLESMGESYVPFTIDGKEYLIRSDEVTQNGMRIVTAFSVSEIRSQLLDAFLPILIAGIISFLIFSLITYLATLRGVKPLKSLGTLMSSVENGDYEVHANVKDYKEVSRLADGFNNMIQSIKKRDEKLMITNKELKLAEEQLRGRYEELKLSQKELKASEEKVKRLASFDSLTGLLNRRSLLEKLTLDIDDSDDKNVKVLLFIDIDNFKTINDTLGHTIGDKVIVEIAKRLRSLPLLNKDVARISGDEFMLVIHDLASEEEAKSIAEEIISLFETPIFVDSRTFKLTASIGVAIYPLHGNTSEELLKIADLAMHYAKGIGKNGFRLFDESIQKETEERLQIELGIREALEKNEFQLYLQPQYNVKEGRISSYEALLRTNSPSLSGFNIFQIIQTAEMTGQIVEIDKWVLRQSCEYAKELNNTIGEDIKISVNISALHIMQPDFVENIRLIVKETEVHPNWIDLEITETSLMESFDTNKQKLEEIKKQGISIHLDDFGTGYSSLNYLTSLSIDIVKIDKSFVDAMLLSEKGSKIIRSIIKLAQNIGLQVVAEGVEYEDQYNLLENNNCDVIQGYYISKPVPFEKIVSQHTQRQKVLK